MLKALIGLGLIIISILFAVWLCLRVMLYGGIMQAIENWGVNNSVVVWGIIKAVFFEAGLIPGYVGVLLGMYLLKD